MAATLIRTRLPSVLRLRLLSSSFQPCKLISSAITAQRDTSLQYRPCLSLQSARPLHFSANLSRYEEEGSDNDQRQEARKLFGARPNRPQRGFKDRENQFSRGGREERYGRESRDYNRDDRGSSRFSSRRNDREPRIPGHDKYKVHRNLRPSILDEFEDEIDANSDDEEMKLLDDPKGKKTFRPRRPSRYEVDKSIEDHDEGMVWVRNELRRNNQRDMKPGPIFYSKQMLRLVHQGQIMEALAVLDVMKEENVRPTPGIFNILITGLAKIGKVRKAFGLYNSMKKRGMEATPYTYTSLFQVCAESPIPSHSLSRVENLRNEINMRIAENRLVLHTITYNAAIKAFARCGAPDTAFEVYDEMLQQKNCPPDVITYSMLLMASAEDKQKGPTKAMLVLDEMKERKIKPDVFTYNLVLNVLRNKIIDSLKSKAHTSEEDLEEFDGSVQADSDIDCDGLFPGVELFIQQMLLNDAEPNIKTFQLLLVLCKSMRDEEVILEMMKGLNVQPDVRFLQTLLRRRGMEDLKQAKAFVESMTPFFGDHLTKDQCHKMLIAACKTFPKAMQLMDIFREEGIKFDEEVYGRFLWVAGRVKDFKYMTEILKLMHEDGVKPNLRILNTLDYAAEFNFKEILEKENLEKGEENWAKRMHNEQQGYRGYLNLWKKTMVPEQYELELNTKKIMASEDLLVVEEDADVSDEEKYAHL